MLFYAHNILFDIDLILRIGIQQRHQTGEQSYYHLRLIGNEKRGLPGGRRYPIFPYIRLNEDTKALK